MMLKAKRESIFHWLKWPVIITIIAIVAFYYFYDKQPAATAPLAILAIVWLTVVAIHLDGLYRTRVMKVGPKGYTFTKDSIRIEGQWSPVKGKYQFLPETIMYSDIFKVLPVNGWKEYKRKIKNDGVNEANYRQHISTSGPYNSVLVYTEQESKGKKEKFCHSFTPEDKEAFISAVNTHCSFKGMEGAK